MPPVKDAESSARKLGGMAEDYLAIHNSFDESKALEWFIGRFFLALFIGASTCRVQSLPNHNVSPAQGKSGLNNPVCRRTGS